MLESFYSTYENWNPESFSIAVVCSGFYSTYEELKPKI